jgi:hypothetical protein
MANPTNPFNWQMPQSTDLVTDLPADFETFGQAVATSMADLLGGTTGQVLSKASNTDMDFTWVAQDDSNAIQNAIVDAKGDLIAATAADTPARLAVGTNGQVLTADSTASTGLAWATPTSGSMTLLSTTTLSGASTTISSISGAYKNLRVLIYGVSNNTADGNFTMKFNGYSDSEYITFNENSTFTVKYNSFYSTATTVTRSDSNNVWDITFGNYASTSANFKSVNGVFVFVGTGSAVKNGNIGGAFYAGGVAISSFTFANTGGNFAGGTVQIYGVN